MGWRAFAAIVAGYIGAFLIGNAVGVFYAEMEADRKRLATRG